jgi:hypothetical protein
MYIKEQHSWKKGPIINSAIEHFKKIYLNWKTCDIEQQILAAKMYDAVKHEERCKIKRMPCGEFSGD